MPRHYLRYVYFAFFESIFRYGQLIYGNASNILNILLLQKKVIILSTDSIYDAHCRPLFKQVKIMTVFNLYIYELLIYMKKNINKFELMSNVHSYSTRNAHKLHFPYVRLSKSQSYYKYFGFKLYSKLPLSIKNLDIRIFKGKVYTWLLENPFLLYPGISGDD